MHMDIVNMFFFAFGNFKPQIVGNPLGICWKSVKIF